MDPKDVGDVSWNPASENLDTLDGLPSVAPGRKLENDRPVAGPGRDTSETGTASPRDMSGMDNNTGSPSSSLTAAPVLAPPYL